MKYVKPFNFKGVIILISVIMLLSVCFYGMFSLKSVILIDDGRINEKKEMPVLSPDDFKLEDIYSKQSMFQVYEIVNMSQGVNGIAVGDFNNDGLIDFAVDNDSENSSTISIFYNEGENYKFSRFDINFKTNYSIKSLLANDFNNDGMIDFVFSYSEYEWFNGMPYNVYGVTSILFGEGDSVFRNETVICRRGSGISKDAEGRINPRVISADFDLDDDIDLLIGDNSGKVELLLNDGNGVFEPSGYIEDFGRLSWGLASDDFDLDGDIDFVVSSLVGDNVTMGCISLKENKFLESKNSACFDMDGKRLIANLSFVPAVANLASIDYDNDRDFDLIVGTSIVLYLLRNENGTFFPVVIGHSNEGEQGFETMHHYGLAVADFNNDRYDDFLLGTSGGKIRLFL